MRRQALAKELDIRLTILARLQEAAYRIRSYPIERSHYVILRMLLEAPRKSSELVEALVLDHTTIARQVGALEKNGLVTRQADPADRRSSIIVATPKGQALCAEMSAIRVERIQAFLDDWDLAEQEELVRSLAHFNDSLMTWLRSASSCLEMKE